MNRMFSRRPRASEGVSPVYDASGKVKSLPGLKKMGKGKKFAHLFVSKTTEEALPEAMARVNLASAFVGKHDAAAGGGPVESPPGSPRGTPQKGAVAEGSVPGSPSLSPLKVRVATALRPRLHRALSPNPHRPLSPSYPPLSRLCRRRASPRRSLRPRRPRALSCHPPQRSGSARGNRRESQKRATRETTLPNNTAPMWSSLEWREGWRWRFPTFLFWQVSTENYDEFLQSLGMGWAIRKIAVKIALTPTYWVDENGNMCAARRCVISRHLTISPYISPGAARRCASARSPCQKS